MKLNKLFFIFILLVFTAVAAVQKNIWKFKISVNNGIETMKVFDASAVSKKPIFTYSAKSITEVFKDAEEVYFPKYKRSVLVTRWAHGSKGETLIIFDPLNVEKHLQFEVVTSWPASVKLVDDKLVIGITDDKFDGDPNPPTMETQWDPAFVTEVKVSDPNSSQAP